MNNDGVELSNEQTAILFSDSIEIVSGRKNYLTSLSFDDLIKIIALVYGPGIAIAAQERLRQINVEGWTAEHDDQHIAGEMAQAAACYAMNTINLSKAHKESILDLIWPPAWEIIWWKPRSRLLDLRRAVALLAAEIDRLIRAGQIE